MEETWCSQCVSEMVVRTPPSRVQAGTMSTAQTSVWSTTAGQCLLRQAIWGVGGGMLYLLRHLVQKSFVKYIKYKNYENWVSMAMKCRFWKIYTFNCSSWKMLFICCIMFVLCCDTISFQILCQPVFGFFCILNSQVGLKTNTLYFCFRDVFTAWVSSRQGSNQFTVKWSAYFEGTH